MYLDGVFLSSFCTAIYGDTQDVLFSSSFRVLSLCQSGLRRISLHLMGPGCFCFTSILPHISSLHPILLIHNAFPFHFFILPQPPPANRQSSPPLFLIPIQPHLTPITSTPVYVFVVSKQVVADGLFIFSPSLSLSLPHIIFSESVSLCWTKGRICSHPYPLVPSLPSFQFRHHI